MNNNSWYYFEHILPTMPDDIRAYFILNKTEKNQQIVKSLSKDVRGRIVWRNSLKHHILYRKADMYFVTLSYRDIIPDRYKRHYNIQPLVYLQHGNTAMKKLGYEGTSYWNSIYKFVTYSSEERDLLINNNNFSDYQLPYMSAHPRYKELVRLNDAANTGESKQILWFLTWREYLDKSLVSESKFLEQVIDVLSDKKLQEYLETSGKSIKVVLHQLFDISKFQSATKAIKGNRISIHYASDIDLMHDIAESHMLITDYSSLGFDFTFLKKPVILYQFDSIVYGATRDFYCNLEEDFDDYRVRTKADLIDKLVGEKYKLNKFFSSRLSKNVNLEDVKAGKHIDRFNQQIIDKQRSKVALVGYNFFGRGGTVAATKSLAEGLAGLGYIVELVSLRRIKTENPFPNGVMIRSFMNPKGSLKESIKRVLFRSSKQKSHLQLDVSRDLLIPYVGFALKRFLNKTNARTVVSTRESLHLFLQDAPKSIVNKLYFFHTTPELVNKIFPGVMDKVSTREVKKALFVSESSRIGYKKLLDFDSYDKYSVTGNAVLSSETLTLDEIKKVEGHGTFKGIVLTRISKERTADLDSLIEFATYLKENSIEGISLDVYGAGDALYDFCDKITKGNLSSVIHYKGLTESPHLEIREHDFLVDFSDSHSFGMIYLEATLNGVICFAKDNMGSREVLSDMPDSIYNGWSDLVSKIQHIPKIPTHQLVRNYQNLQKRYSTAKVAKAVEKLID